MVVSIDNTPGYQWGEKCEGWRLHSFASLSVIQEKMPPQSSEQNHFHQHAQQVFFILSGTAEFEMDGKIFTLHPVESIHVPAGTPHKIMNLSSKDLHFLVISQPQVQDDRVNIND